MPAFLLGSFEKLLNYVIFTDAVTLVVVASTLFVLRRRRSGEGGFRMPGYPFLPAFYMVCLFGVAVPAVCLAMLSGVAALATVGFHRSAH